MESLSNIKTNKRRLNAIINFPKPHRNSPPVDFLMVGFFSLSRQ